MTGRPRPAPAAVAPAMASRLLREARVEAMERRPRAVFIGGPVLGDDPESCRLRHTRNRRPVDRFDPDATFPGRLDGEYAYLGIAFSHFGHAMAEMIHRILPTRSLVPDPRWIILGRKGTPDDFARLPAISRTILALLGVDGTNCTVVNRNTIVERLLVVEAGADLAGRPKDWYFPLLEGVVPRLVGAAATARPQRLYVSRARLGPGSGVLGEGWLEGAFERAGFTVLHPQEHGLVEQMAFYAAAEVVVFAEGSACHGVELFGRGALGHTVLLNRRQIRRSPFDEVLRPRSRRYDRFDGNLFLGSVLTDGSDPLAHLGVALLDVVALSAFLAAAGIGPLPGAARGDYLAAAEADLEAYVAAAPDRPQTFDPALVDGVRAAFAAAAQRVGAGG